MTVYNFTAKDNLGNDVPLDTYKGKVLLIVNTATGCGFTPQYEELQNMYDELKEEGFEILDFPCNQFMNQAPGSDAEIQDFCTSKFSTTFPRFSKVDVNGENAAPVFKWLTENTVFQGFEGKMATMMKLMAKARDKDYKNNGKVKWNFTKFVIDRNGEIAARFEPTADLAAVKAKIKEVL
ncbi:MAG: glutathione peroxidase [Clostridia bacterium]|nr:glutathione peroxidase [Clostridia bacterium]